MPKKPAHFAYLIAVRQPDGSDHVYAILAQSVDEAVKVAAAREPEGPAPRHVGSLGSHTVERIKLQIGEARII
ncbi:hypothetical protein [Methylobacterium sp. E-045]|uniref:hypothetical protein n=1 Tax=Methylobacterium sp. E-045 TaxID=2836575 RepID=UPI001FBB532A|nr:hypothetical protein [Methylobacterium sp. E-045]MCJ2131563.1 hypothetical protein [Methylobacterium sp. E-045]